MNKTAMITGASKGIGKELCYLFAKDKIDLVLVARSADILEKLATELRKDYDITIHIFALDLSDISNCKKLFEQTQEQKITIDYLVNNAGFGENGVFWEVDFERNQNMINLNIASLTALTQLYTPSMVERGFGHILNVASVAAFQPGPNMSVYYASKAYVLHFTEGLAAELDGKGVYATALCPGPTKTEFAKEAHADNKALFKVPWLMDADIVAYKGYEAMNNREVVAITGNTNWLISQLPRMTPRGLVRRVTARINKM